MTNQGNEEQYTPEQFQFRVLKQRFAEKLANAEEEISALFTRNAMLEQENQQLKAQLEEAGEDVPETAAS